jgi:hypothetical protein
MEEPAIGGKARRWRPSNSESSMTVWCCDQLSLLEPPRPLLVGPVASLWQFCVRLLASPDGAESERCGCGVLGHRPAALMEKTALHSRRAMNHVFQEVSDAPFSSRSRDDKATGVTSRRRFLIRFGLPIVPTKNSIRLTIRCATEQSLDNSLPNAEEHRVLIRATGTKTREPNTGVTPLTGGLLVRVQPEEPILSISYG